MVQENQPPRSFQRSLMRNRMVRLLKVLNPTRYTDQAEIFYSTIPLQWSLRIQIAAGLQWSRSGN